MRDFWQITVAVILFINGVFLYIINDDNFRWVFIFLGALIMAVALIDVLSRRKNDDR